MADAKDTKTTRCRCGHDFDGAYTECSCCRTQTQAKAHVDRVRAAAVELYDTPAGVADALKEIADSVLTPTDVIVKKQIESYRVSCARADRAGVHAMQEWFDTSIFDRISNADGFRWSFTSRIVADAVISKVRAAGHDARIEINDTYWVVTPIFIQPAAEVYYPTKWVVSRGPVGIDGHYMSRMMAAQAAAIAADQAAAESGQMAAAEAADSSDDDHAPPPPKPTVLVRAKTNAADPKVVEDMKKKAQAKAGFKKPKAAFVATAY